jgi:hypothetical protein
VYFAEIGHRFRFTSLVLSPNRPAGESEQGKDRMVTGWY